MLGNLLRTARVLAIGLLLAPAVLAGPGVGRAAAASLAQDLPEPPSVDAPLLQSPLSGPDIFDARSCPTGLAWGSYVGEGFKLSVKGRCVTDAPAANLPLPAPRIAILDHDVAVDFKAVAGVERAGLNLYARVRDSANLTTAYINFGGGKIELIRRDGAVNRTVSGRTDLNDLIDRSDWNRVALRLRGTEVWVLLNDAPVLYAGDMSDQPGGIGIGLVREGNPDDTAEVAVVFRNLAISSLSASDEP
jgi:hypothetical protein